MARSNLAASAGQEPRGIVENSGAAAQNEEGILLVLTLIIGAVVGLVVVAFILLTENLGSRLYPAGGAAWRRLTIPVMGSLLTGFLLARYFPNARGSGIPQTKTALFIRDGFIAFRTVLGKFGLSSLSLASGIALGREGPSVQVGAGIASVLGRRVGLSPASVKALVPVGASAALAAAFNTPIAAVLFSLEEVMGDMHAPVLGSIVLSSATSWIVLHLLLGDEPLFHVPAYQLVHPIEFLWYAALGIAGGLVSVAFVKLLLWQRKRFLKMPKSSLWIQPTAGGLLVGALGWFVPPVLGVGYNYVGQALNGQMVVSLMALLVLMKVLATATCYASGNAGGIFGPSLYIGAMVGGSVGGVAHMLMPDYTGNAGAYALVGMGAAFAGIVRVPLTSVIMIFEMTRDYSIIVPLMIANLVSYFISSRLQEEPIYEALQHQDGIHLPSGARARSALLMVGNAFEPAAESLPVSERIAQALASVDRKRGAWPVIDQNGLRGVITAEQLDKALASGRGEDTLSDLVPEPPASDQLTAENFPHVHPDHSLDDALRRILQQDLKILPVVSRTNIRDLKGTISVENILAAYRIGNAPTQREPGTAAAARRITPRVAALVALAAVVILAGFLNYFYRAGRIARADEFYKSGTQLVSERRYEEAIGQFRNALSISHRLQDRLALGLALQQAGHTDEAALYLRQVVEQQPDSAPAHLGLARIALARGNTSEAISQYRRAIDGTWPQNAAEDRFETRFQLADLLTKAGRRDQAQAELLALAAEAPQHPEYQKRAARTLADIGLPNQSVAVYREVLRRNPPDAGALDGLGQEELALGDFAAAHQAFAGALKIDPGDSTAEKSAALSSEILALDPTQPGLRAAERYERSRQVLQRVLGAVQSCGFQQSSIQKAQAAAEPRRRPASLFDTAEENVALAAQLWRDAKSCAAKPSGQEPLPILMDKLSRQ